MSILINKNSKVYVLCPAYLKSGGPELLHQLVFELNENGINAYITYYNINKNNSQFTVDDFKKYIKNYKTVDEIEDLENNIIISPEVIKAIKITKKINNAKKIIWWLSVANFEKTYGIKNSLKNFGLFTTFILIIKREILHDLSYIQNMDTHFCQSYYAIEYLNKNGINNVVYLSDYINDSYLRIQDEWGEKQDFVVYNPKKGLDFTKKIMDKASNLNFVPIENLTTEQVKDLLLKSKVYIDFGDHPGKDRFPREAAMCGCCIITGKKGAARYYKDVPIKNEFKFEDNEDNIDLIVEKINNCIMDYDDEIVKFNDYRKCISQEKMIFKKDVKNFFCNEEIFQN